MSRLKSFRKEKGISQESMARKMGVTLSLYEKVENNRAGASAAFMKKLKLLYPDANIDFIFFDTNSNDVAD